MWSTLARARAGPPNLTAARAQWGSRAFLRTSSPPELLSPIATRAINPPPPGRACTKANLSNPNRRPRNI
ncbi:hypothetical protein TIFTF001_023096 [Ficus carica]|uniref:Uncharacterized protein n=1 Tax=Ficus carica TaxID=3494 RepID=A0AA88DDF5_FICCA|nr:hypothetical protein TIFTF001_023096 [Ficus carica]